MNYSDHSNYYKVYQKNCSNINKVNQGNTEHFQSFWHSVTICLTKSCEVAEKCFSNCVGEKNSKMIGDFFLLSFLVSRPKPNTTRLDDVAYHRVPLSVNEDDYFTEHYVVDENL